jgi:hypothetical protein
MDQYLKHFAELSMRIKIVQAIEEKFMNEQTRSEHEQELKNLNAAELIRAKVEELKILD